MLCFFLSEFSFSQVNATTDNGKVVILNDDGTWEYKTEEDVDASDYSLECSDIIETTVDKMTGKSSTAATETLIISNDGGKNGLGIYALNGANSTIVVIQAVGAGNCMDDDNKVNILFRDGSRLELYNNGKFNCEAKMTLYFGGIFGKNKQMKELASKEIETMRVWTSKSYVEKDFSSYQSKQFMNTVKCLSES
ncbi:hypothetical protein [Maribacter sp. 1_2014MBL_MicDiv]|uniref:hypothetical protein n=1 Tax=Maribacter sp. 1_2014MBL_MicDiv TaxID=1644130 RepID=UPI0008F469E2|nr:hypothetical protein [Maribacter sp. 1_2014MBL_MicDiv]APA65656.1 hypothetical protein YQ22_15840 [Maribacter sp. 1_2014MBL_MicDiv]